MSALTTPEKVARDRLLAAIEALREATVECAFAGFGSLVMAPLDDARKQQEYALAVIEGRV